MTVGFLSCCLTFIALHSVVLLHKHIAPVHKSVIAMAAINDIGFELIEHPPYSPDLAPSDLSISKRIKNLVPTFGQMMTSYIQWSTF